MTQQSQYKASQRRDWDRTAPAWEYWDDVIQSGARDVSQAVIEMARINQGYRVVDIASGTGHPALAIAHRVGPSGRVIASDMSAAMLAIVRSRATAQGLGNMDFIESDAEALDFPEGTADAATCRFGLMFLPNLAGALARIHGFLRPGGWFAAAVWDVAPRVPFLSMPMGAAASVFGEAPMPPPGTPRLFDLAEPGVLQRAFASAGFTEVEARTVMARFELPTEEEYVRMVMDTAPPIAALMERQPAGRQQEFRQALTNAARDHRTPEGTIGITNAALCVAGQRQEPGA